MAAATAAAATDGIGYIVSTCRYIRFEWKWEWSQLNWMREFKSIFVRQPSICIYTPLALHSFIAKRRRISNPFRGEREEREKKNDRPTRRCTECMHRKFNFMISKLNDRPTINVLFGVHRSYNENRSEQLKIEIDFYSFRVWNSFSCECEFKAISWFMAAASCNWVCATRKNKTNDPTQWMASRSTDWMLEMVHVHRSHRYCSRFPCHSWIVSEYVSECCTS